MLWSNCQKMKWENFWGDPFYCGLFFLNCLLVCVGVIWIIVSVIYAVRENQDNTIPDTHTIALYRDSQNFLIFCIIAHLICAALLFNCFVIGCYFGLWKEGRGAIKTYCIILIVIGIASLMMGVAMCAVPPEGKRTFIRESFKDYKTHELYIRKIEKNYFCCSPFPEQDLIMFVKYCNDKKYSDCVTVVHNAYRSFGLNSACVAFTLAIVSIFAATWGCYLSKTMRQNQENQPPT